MHMEEWFDAKVGAGRIPTSIDLNAIDGSRNSRALGGFWCSF
jgi:hypothetical protein